MVVRWYDIIDRVLGVLIKLLLISSIDISLIIGREINKDLGGVLFLYRCYRVNEIGELV